MVISSRLKVQLGGFFLSVAVTFSTQTLCTGANASSLARKPNHAVAQQKTWKPGDHVEVEWKGDWYQAQVIEVNANQYKIHYDGYASSWDEWVDSSRIRPVTAKQNNPPVTSQSPATSSPMDQILELLKQSYERQTAGQTDEAISLAERAVNLAEKNLGPEHGLTAMSLTTLAQLCDQKRDFNRAELLYLRALAIAEKPAAGLEPFFVATILQGLGRVYDLRGDFLRAEAMYKRALEIQEKSLGPEDPNLATPLTSLGVIYQTKGDYAQAERLLVRALSLREKAPRTEATNELFVIQSMKSLASLYETKGDFDKAGALLEQVVTRLEKLLGPDHPILAAALSDFAIHTKNQGDYVKAEQLYQRAIAIVEKAHGPDHASVAVPLDNLANLYMAKGDYQRAESFYKRALTIKEKSLRPDDPELATTLSNLGVLYEEQRKYDLAEPLHQRALAIKEKALGPMHPEVATILSNLQVLYYDKGDYEKAESFSQRVLLIKEKALGPEHPDVAIAINNLAALEEKRGDYQAAEKLYLRALTIYEKKLGSKHPDTSIIVFNLALLSAAQGQTTQAISYLTRGTDISEYNAGLILATGSEEQKSRYMSTISSETDYTVSLHLRSVPSDLSAARLALTTILRRKGRALDAMTEQLAALRRRSDPQDRALLEQLVAVRSQLATLVFDRAARERSEQQAEVAKLEAEVQKLEAAVSARSAEFRAQSQPVTIENVKAAMPPDTALIEIASYHPFNSQAKRRSERYGPARYAAYVIRKDGANPSGPSGLSPGALNQAAWVDLGDAAAINNDVDALRRVLRNPGTTNVKQFGKALYEKVMRPIVPLLGKKRRLFLSPDGDLNLVPFGAIVDDDGRYLVETYSITYLTSGRDLLRLQVHAESKQGPVVFADPLFNQISDTGKPTVPAAPRNGEPSDLRNLTFKPLPGTAQEARALGAVLSGVKLWTGAQATEAALKQVSGPSILHIATHGFFLSDQAQAFGGSGESARGIILSRQTQTAVENPLLRSGLALAGVNQHQSGAGEDGVLTALEATGLDLWGTKLVILSACETGLGEVKNGEGVYGLRRALVLAGSESQVMSLWAVSDAGTRDLMTDYYKRLQAGEGRTEALRQVQLAMIKSKSAGGRRQPAGAGNTAPTSSPEPAASAAPVSSEQRGVRLDPRQKTAPEDRSHPFYWASFIQSGEWRSLGGNGLR